jgi:hypothetical protein
MSQVIAEHPKAQTFEQWKRAVGLPSAFPELPFIGEADWAERFYRGPKHKEKIEDILDVASSPLLAVIVKKGHGASTLSRYVFHEISQESVRRRLLPVRLSLDDFLRARESEGDPGYREIEQWLDEGLRQGIVQSLVQHQWDRVLGKRPYARLIGAVASESGDTGASRGSDVADDPPGDQDPLTRTIESRRAKILAGLQAENRSYSTLRNLSPAFSEPISELTARLSQTYGVRISLQFDLSSSISRRGDIDAAVERYDEAYLRSIETLKRVAKDFIEGDGTSAKPTMPSVLNEIYFMSEDGYQALTDGWLRDYEEIEFPWYRPADIFAMLAHHYPQRQRSGMPPVDALASVLDSNLLIPCVSEHRSLDFTVRLFTKELLDQLDPWEELAYQLTPWKRQIDDLRKQIEEGSAELEKSRAEIARLTRVLKKEFPGADLPVPDVAKGGVGTDA